MDSQLTFVRIKKCDSHAKILYELLKKREFGISHCKIPDYEQHKRFVYQHPYRFWYLIKINSAFIGSLYILKSNCVGIYVLNQNMAVIEKAINWVQKTKKPLKEIKSVRPSNFYVNVNPNNDSLISALKHSGASLIEITYLLAGK